MKITNTILKSTIYRVVAFFGFIIPLITLPITAAVYCGLYGFIEFLERMKDFGRQFVQAFIKTGRFIFFTNIGNNLVKGKEIVWQDIWDCFWYPWS